MTHARTLILSLCFLIPSLLPAFPPELDLRFGEWFELELGPELEQHLQTLGEDEKADQLRDWAAIAAIETFVKDEDEAFYALYDFPLVRHDFLKPLQNFHYGKGRSIALSDGSLFIFAPAGQAERQAVQARQADRYRMVNGRKPARVYLVDYEIDEALSSVRYQLTKEEPGEKFFTSEYGYYEFTVRDARSLKEYTEGVDDLTFAQYINGRLSLGGRRFAKTPALGITLEEIAALYQADQNLVEEFEKRIGGRGLREEYNNIVRKAANDEVLENPFILTEMSLDDIMSEIRTTIPYPIFEQQAIQSFIQNNGLNIGFSLDPKLKFRDFSRALNQAVDGDEAFYRNLLKEEKKDYREYVELNANDYRIKIQLASISEEELEDIETAKPNATGLLALIGKKEQAEENQIPQEKERALSLEEREKRDKRIAYLADTLAKKQVGKIRELINRRADILREIAQGAASNNMDAYYDFRQFLNGELDKGPIKKGDTGYKVDDIKAMLDEVGYSVSSRAPVFDDELEEAVMEFQRDMGIKPDGMVGIQTWEKLEKEETERMAELKQLDNFLQQLHSYHSFQHGRYDGYLEGTPVGMNLYYTDLMMKLWSFDYGGSAPEEQVQGYQAEPNHSMSPIYWEEIWDFPSTRSWLGPLEQGYELHDNDGSIYFAHVATKIYNASSNDLFPGAEVEANPASTRFSSWWNNHYSEVADYEPQYHKLNQIMKWSSLLALLKTDHSEPLPYLRSVPVRHNYDFERWYDSNQNLRTRLELPFIPKESVGQNTECLDIFKSKTFKGYGSSSVYLSGGVTLGSKKTLAPKMGQPKSNIANKAITRPGVDYKRSGGSGRQLEMEFFDGRRQALDLKNKRVLASNTKNEALKGSELSLSKKGSPATSERSILQAEEGMEITDRLNEVPLGKLKVQQKQGKVALELTDNEITRAENITRAMLEKPSNPEGGLLEAGNARNVIRLPEEQGYLCKMEGSNNWVLITEEASTATPRAVKASFDMGKEYAYTSSVRKVSILPESEAARLAPSGEWKVFTNSNNNKASRLIAEVRADGPTDGARVYLTRDGARMEAMLNEEGLWARSTGRNFDEALKATEPLHNKVSGQQYEMLRGLADLPDGTTLVLRDAEGKLMAFTRSEGSASRQLQSFDELFPQGSNIEGAYFNPGRSSGLRFNKNNALEVAAEPGARDRELIQLLQEKTSKNKNILKAFPEGEIVPEDLNFLSRIDPGNVDLLRAYPEYRGLSPNLQEGQAFIDLRTGSEANQFLFFKKGGGLEVGNGGRNVDIRAILENLDAHYRKGSLISREALTKETQPVVEFLEQAVEQTGAKTLITKEFGTYDLQSIWNLHGKNPAVRFVPDQPDILLSLENYQFNITAKPEKSVFLNTTAFEEADPNIPKELLDTYREFRGSGIRVQENVDWYDFLDALYDSTRQQLFLAIHNDGYYYSFFEDDRGLFSLESALMDMPHYKDFIYIITNNADAAREAFSSFGKFRRVYISEFRSGDANSFHRCLDMVKRYANSVTKETYIISEKKLAKLEKKHPELRGKLKKSPAGGGNVGISISPAERKLFSAKAWERAASYWNRQKAPASNVDEVLEQLNREEMEALKSGRYKGPKPKNNIDVLRSMIRFKVYEPPARKYCPIG